eukprot:CAMPEP_0203874814 /NCGR_PEP_ID=MMETSP0359-20131031/20481_1 /ASSEMBLY_ACC=CAM_ASM_000338 /TAXON_ID=268821 /ORGANISM="Scrippsiella Hangoei, Strain SHTV-5" /LENGTH=578 /DNA_ID=CAMNT_0050793593 /DNA_START=135 /DNA_END=1872 /DNA_ORIENTATION=+
MHAARPLQEVGVEDVVPQLALAAKQVHCSDGRLDLTSPSWQLDCITLLSCIDWAARALKMPIESRKYREEFTINYRALFPDMGSRHYRVDIFEAALQWNCTRWVNGERFDLAVETAQSAEGLQSAWAALNSSLAEWGADSHAKIKGGATTKLREVLSAFDVAWAHFEHKYIIELIDIEAAARGLVLAAVKEEQQLKELERSQATGTEGEAQLRSQRSQFLARLSRLNSAANLSWKGHHDRGAEVLEMALEALKESDCSKNASSSHNAQVERVVMHVLANGVVEAFEKVRGYIHEVSSSIDSVHPHLCNNDGLVSQMSTWTDSWELASRFMEPAPLLKAVCEVIGAIHTSRRFIPSFATMFEECDVELFLVLPRMVWLWFLTDPDQHIELMRRLVPHHLDCQLEPPARDEQLDAFTRSFHRLMKALVDTLSDHGVDKLCRATEAKQRAWEVLVARVVAGPSVMQNTSLKSLTEAAAANKTSRFDVDTGVDIEIASAAAALESFVYELERWSIELQRHRPEYWCQCSSVLVRCLAKEKELGTVELPSVPQPSPPTSAAVCPPASIIAVDAAAGIFSSWWA